MSEMLGNQYFMARNYASACVELEKVLKVNPTNKPVRCKLIICYMQSGKLQKAFDLFISLCHEDIDFIMNMDPIKDDCPCFDILPALEKQFNHNKDRFDYLLKLGITALYCDLAKSIKYFGLAHKLERSDLKVKYVLNLLKLRMEKDEIFK